MDRRRDDPPRLGRTLWRPLALAFACFLAATLVHPDGATARRVLAAAGVLALWIGAVVFVVSRPPRPEPDVHGGARVVRPSARVRYGMPALFVGPLLLVLLAAGPPGDPAQRGWFYALAAIGLAVGAVPAALDRRAVRLHEDGFEVMAADGHGARVAWSAIARIEYDRRSRRLVLLAGTPPRQAFPVPHAWNGAAAFARSALDRLPWTVLAAAPEERRILEALAVRAGRSRAA